MLSDPASIHPSAVEEVKTMPKNKSSLLWLPS